MPLQVDPDNITYEVASTPSGSNMLTVDTAGNRIFLTEVGVLDSDGVTFQCLYSKVKEIWKDDSSLIPFSFPLEAITAESFEFLDGWAPADSTTRNLLRTAGWSERNSSGNIIAQYAGIISLGTLGGTDQPYYDNTGAVTNFTYQGPINEAIQILDDPNGDGSYADGFDRRSSLTIYAREQAKSYAVSDLAGIGVSQLAPQAYRFPLANSDDLKVTESDVTVDAYGVTVTFHNVAQSRNIGGSSYDFGIIIDGNNRTAEEIYMAVQSLLRKSTDIDNDASTLVGQLAPELLEFVGDSLQTKFASNPESGGNGVYIDNFQLADQNRIQFQDNTDTSRTFPFVSTGTINFNANLQNDASSIYRMFFTTNPAGDFGTSNAVLVDDSAGSDIAGLVSGNASIAFDFDYQGNAQGGRTPNTDADVTIVAIGTSGAQYVVATGTITRSTGLTFTLTANLERNYLNP